MLSPDRHPFEDDDDDDWLAAFHAAWKEAQARSPLRLLTAAEHRSCHRLSDDDRRRIDAEASDIGAACALAVVEAIEKLRRFT